MTRDEQVWCMARAFDELRRRVREDPDFYAALVVADEPLPMVDPATGNTFELSITSQDERDEVVEIAVTGWSEGRIVLWPLDRRTYL